MEPCDVALPGSGCVALIWMGLPCLVGLALFGWRQLEGGPGGTLVTLTYNFAHADMKGPLCVFTSCLPAILKWQLHTAIAP